MATQTTFRWLAHTATVAYGRAAAVTAALISSAGAPMPDREVRLWSRPIGATRWRAGRVKRTDGNGRATWIVVPVRNTDYVVRFLGERDRLASATGVARVKVTRGLPKGRAPLPFVVAKPFE